MDAKIELRRSILTNMCYIAENIYDFYYSSFTTNMRFFNSECPKAFTPSVADKFLFNKILDDVMDNIVNESEIIKGKCVPPIGPRMLAVQVLSKYYWPQYGEWIIMPKLSYRSLFM